ncbi:MAG TPA: hypothetical protein VK427_13845, partial [Kofleriaceae bacterium]|nr:hypothetical protein [Kofleriaceae bacterium]
MIAVSARVRKVPVSVAMSVAMHATAVAWIARLASHERAALAGAPAPPIVSATTTTAEAPAVDVQLLDEAAMRVSDPTRVVERATSPTRTRTTAKSRAAVASERAPETSTGMATPPPRDGKRASYFTMREGGRPDLTLPARDAFDGAAPDAPASGPATGVPRRGQFARAGHTSDLGPFVARVDRDGRVTIEDRPDLSVEIALPTPKQIWRGIADWYKSDKGPDGKRGARTLESLAGGGIDSPRADCEGVRDNACMGDRTKTFVAPVLRGGLNVTDWLMRRTVGDPYASRKRVFLDSTRDERAQLRAAHRTEQLRATAQLMRSNLEAVWASSTDPRTRKQALFALWDEIAEPSRDDPALAEATRAARAHVIEFI